MFKDDFKMFYYVKMIYYNSRNLNFFRNIYDLGFKIVLNEISLTGHVKSHSRF